MAQVKLLKIGPSGQPKEMDTVNDDITLNSYTVDGGPVLDLNLDMNNGNIEDVNDISFTDPTTDGITNSNGTFPADDIMFDSFENVMEVGAAILFPSVADDSDQLDAFRLPQIAGAPTAAPADGGEGYLAWDSTNNAIYAWDGAAWSNLSIVEEAERVCSMYTAGEALASGDVVYISAANTVSLADASAEPTARIIGVAGAAIANGAMGRICSDGVVNAFTGLTPGERYFQDPAVPGGVTTTVPTGSGETIFQIGYAKSATEMTLQLDYLGCRA